MTDHRVFALELMCWHIVDIYPLANLDTYPTRQVAVSRIPENLSDFMVTTTGPRFHLIPPMIH